MRRLIFEETSFDDFIEWSEGNRKSDFKRLVKLIAEVRRTPFEGTGKPEPLKENLSGYCRAADAVAKNYGRASLDIQSDR